MLTAGDGTRAQGADVTYSLVSVPSLGFDLVRLPRGDDVARVLVTALQAEAADLEVLAAQHPGPSRRVRWQQVRCAAPRESIREALRLAGPAFGLAVDGERQASTALLARLERAPLGGLDGLDRFVRHDVLDWTWTTSGDETGADTLATQSSLVTRAADVLVDAAAAGYASEALTLALRTELEAPFSAAVADAGRSAEDPLAAVPAHVVSLLAVLRAVSPDERDAWRQAADRLRARTDVWAPAMHDAAWALHLCGRIRMSGVCQLEAVRAFHRAGFTARDGSYGVWNAISGVVQAQVVQDLLSDHARQTLLRPWMAVYGSEPPG